MTTTTDPATDLWDIAQLDREVAEAAIAREARLSAINEGLTQTPGAARRGLYHSSMKPKTDARVTPIDGGYVHHPRRVPQSTSTRTYGPSDKQVKFLTTLAQQHGRDLGKLTVWLDSGVTGPQVSAMIDRLLALPRPVAAAASHSASSTARHTAAVDVPGGRYAVDSEEGELRFYDVDRPTKGDWAGCTFLSVQASGQLYPIRFAATRDAILAKIAVDPKAAMLRYGREIGRCGHCNAVLTNTESRARGCGPICLGKMG